MNGESAMLLYFSRNATGHIETDPVPGPGLVEVFGASQSKPENIFDIAIFLQGSDDGVTWETHDIARQNRKIGQDGFIYLSYAARLSTKYIRAVIDLGQNDIALTVVVSEGA